MKVELPCAAGVRANLGSAMSAQKFNDSIDLPDVVRRRSWQINTARNTGTCAFNDLCCASAKYVERNGAGCGL